MINAGHTFPKTERLCARKDISALLSGGRWHRCGVLKACIAPGGGDVSRVMVSVPKRLFKRAVKRNLLKRRIREAYRLQKDILQVSDTRENRCFDILLQYNSADIASFDAIKDDVAEILRRAVG